MLSPDLNLLKEQPHLCCCAEKSTGNASSPFSAAVKGRLVEEEERRVSSQRAKGLGPPSMNWFVLDQ